MKIFTLQGCVNCLHAEDLECCLSSSFKANSRILLGCPGDKYFKSRPSQMLNRT